jgi:hypothetical protein
MPNWKKVIVSGSDAILNKVTIPGNSGATTFTTNADTLIFSGSAYFTGSVNITGSLQATSITGSLLGTSSYADYALTASYALNGGGGGGGGSVFSYHQTSSAVTWSISHNLNTYTPIIQVYDDSYNQIIPASISGSSVNTVQITFSTAETGYAVLTTGGNVNISGSNATLVQATPATTWSFAHGLNEKYPVFTIFDNNDDVIVPLKIHADNANTASIYFTTARTGTAVAANCGLSGSTFVSSSYALTASYVANASSFPYTGSALITGSLGLTGSFNVTGSTTQIGNTSLFGNTTISGSLTVSGSVPGTATNINIYGDTSINGAIKFLPSIENIDTSVSASYIFVSGSTQDLYFSQNGSGFNNITRLRWLEGNLYTGLLNGGLITTSSSTVYQVSSGSGIIVNLNGSLNANPYPTVKYLNWGNLSSSISSLTASYDQQFVGIDDTGDIYKQGTPFTTAQYDTLIPVGIVLHQNRSTINGTKTQPSLAYSWKQRSNVFVQAFGPLKLSGHTLSPSGSSTGSLVVGSGTSFSDGANYPVDPNNPSYITDPGTSVSKIFRYRQSGSQWVYDTNGGAGYATINPTQYSANGVLTAVSGSGSNKGWSIQRTFWYPNSVTKAIVVYYGNAQYATELDAIANIQYEPFVEAPNTSANAIYLGALVVRNDANFTDTTSYKIQPGGLFRQVGGSGGGGSTVTTTLSGLSDVLISGPTDHQPFAYDTTAAKWTNQSSISASLKGNADTATSASHAISSSYAISASYSISSSYATSASYADNTTTASFALSSPTPTLQQVINAGNGVSNYGGNGSASIQSTNFTNNRTLYLNDNSYPTIRLVDNLNASNNLQIDIATLSLNGTSYNWSDIVSSTSSYALTASYVNASNVYGTGSFSGSLSGSASGNLKYVGTWNGTMYGYYLINDVVKYGGATYVVNSNVYGNTPPDQDGSFTLLTAGFPYTGSAQMTGSLGITGSASISGSLLITGSNSFLAVDEIYSGDGIIGPTNRILTKNNNLGWGEIGDVVIYSSNNDVYIHAPGGDVRLNAGGGTNIIQVTGSLVLGTGATGSFTGSFSGSYTGSLNGTSSYADYATSASYALTASYLNPITSGYIVLTQVSQSLNFADDASAASGGVPLGGLYRNGNFIAIRIV